MDLATGIFLSSALIALVLLYGFTKDRWRWRKIVSRTLLTCITLVVGIGGAIVMAQYWDEIFPIKLARQTQYAGLKIGTTPDEVMYIKGYPPFVLVEEKSDPAWKGWLKVIKTGELEKGRKATDYVYWSYNHYKYNLNIVFNEERTAVVAIQCHSEDKLFRCPSVGAITDGTTEQQALRKLAARAEQRIDGVSKMLRFPELGVKLLLSQEQVYVVEVYDPKSAR